MSELEYIPINIWDDFWDDGYVPEGDKPQTYIYVEDSDIQHEKRKEYLEVLLQYINQNLNTEGIKLWMEFYESRKKYPNLVGNPDAEKLFFDRWEIKVEGLTHKRLDEWMKILQDVDLKVDDTPFYIYSQS
jgi:deoxyribodipyrimidine photolyase